MSSRDRFGNLWPLSSPEPFVDPEAEQGIARGEPRGIGRLMQGREVRPLAPGEVHSPATRGDVLDVAHELHVVAQLLEELVAVDSGEAITTPRRLVLDAQRNPVDWMVEAADQFHSAKIDNPTDATLYVGFAGGTGTPTEYEEIVSPRSWRIFTRPFDVVSVGFDPANPPALPASIPATFYSRPLTPAGGVLSRPGGAAAIVGDTLAAVADPGTAPLKIGGVFRSVLPTIADGQRAEAMFNQRQQIEIALGFQGASGDGEGAGKLYDHAGASRILGVGSYSLGTGGIWNRLRFADAFKIVAGLTIVPGTPQAIWTPAAGKKFRLLGWHLFANAATAIKLLDAATEIERIGVGANLSTPSPPMGNGQMSNAANNVLNIDATIGATITGIVFGTEE